jgi:hypothetical protein
MSYEDPTMPISMAPSVPPCAYHPDRPATGFCNQCGQAVCPDCDLPHGDRRLCPVCAASAGKPAPNTVAIVLAVIAGALFICTVALGIALSGARNAALPPATPGAPLAGAPPEGALTGPEEALTAPAFMPSAPPPMPLTAPSLPVTPPIPATSAARTPVAISTALTGQPGWVGKVVSHSRDWKSVTVNIGPSMKALTIARNLEWNTGLNGYDIMSQAPVPAPAAPTPPAPKPSEKSVRAAALANEPSGYLAKVVSHSSDWKQATLYTGPPNGEWTSQYRFHWDDQEKQYILDELGKVGGTGLQQGP